MRDPVMADLHRHLAQQDRDDARSEAEEEIIQDWMEDQKMVEDTLVNSELLEEEDFLTIVAAAVVSGDWHRVQGYVENGLKQQWEEAAAREFDKRIRQSEEDAAEARAESRMADREYFDGSI